MSSHYRDYVSAPTFIRFPPCAGLPPAHPYVWVSQKDRATAVYGNIGEAVTGFVARHVLGAAANEILHVRPGKKLKAPDYMLRIGPQPRARLLPLWPAAPAPPIPVWWPAEAKAGANITTVRRTLRTKAFTQLAAY